MHIKSTWLLCWVLIVMSGLLSSAWPQFAGRKKYAEPRKEHESVFSGELDQQDGKLNNFPADCFELSVQAGQHLHIRYAKTGNSHLANLCLMIYGPDGLYKQETGEQSIECDLDISKNGKLFVALTTNDMGERYGAYNLQVRGLDRPVQDIVQPLSAKDFLDVMDSHRLPLTKDQDSWGEEKPNSKAIEFGLDKFDAGHLEHIIFAKTNQIRRKNGLPDMEYSEVLNRSARQHSKEMAELNYFSHESPVHEYATPDIRIRNVFGFTGRRIAENIGTQTFTGNRMLLDLSYEKLADDAMRMWMNSSGHRKQILSKDLNVLGVGCALMVDGDKTSFYYTQNFGGI